MTTFSTRMSRVSSATLALLLTACGGDSPAPADNASATGETSPTVEAGALSASDAPIVASNARGEALYASNCVSCHQPNGQGIAGAFPPLAGSEWVTGVPDRPIAIVMHGLQGPITVAGNEYNSMMTPWGVGSPMSDDDLAAVITYVRTSWGNAASTVTIDDVARVRAAVGGRTAMWTAGELQKSFP